MNSDPVQDILTAGDSREPQSRSVAVPIWLIVLMVLLLYWGAVYFDQNGGWFSAKVYSPYRSLQEVESFQFRAGAGDVFELGRMVYNKPTCVACHQASGQGNPGQFPPLAASEWVNEPEPGRMIRLVLNGLQGPITVKGQSFNNSMVAWNMLSDQEIAAVITYVRQNKEWGNNAPAVTPAQVKSVREKIVKAHPAPFNPDELMKISPAE
ncbi:MAG TPA: cytochrome c [Verrucomicrobiae bacterium]|nr:cytochrome c [Verrucomicrobiae bacterium]